ncbi:DNA topoisomerase 3-alpha [Diachasmimorpha longicaudata]|uniref:DNA topoisomerase 3-alpha n=1 Tax=Diachasmimorpha longicaudata TaxID=58733 RepID=UPI0030B88BFE
MRFRFFGVCLDIRRNFNEQIRGFCEKLVASEGKGGNVMKVLNVAEKNDAAKNIAGLLSRGVSRRREGLSKYNKIYEFETNLWNQNCTMVMTSVSGHLLNYDFVGAYRKWQGCHPLSLFDAPVAKQCLEDYQKIKKTIEREVRPCGALIIWTDCDREGENIGYEIIQVCQAIKPNIRIYRATFSEITATSIRRAIQNLGEPNKQVSDAVDVRSELDLRIGAAFTRFQTLRLQKVFPNTLADMLISYGSCQFPTLGFVVERFLAIERFKSEPYWKLKVSDDHDNINVEFRWARHRLFEKTPCQVFLDICLENPDATVDKIMTKPKSKWRPVPLDTVELEKQGSRKLRLNAKETMRIAERLYTQGFISYPRTETNIFPQGLNLQPLVEQQANHPEWGEFAQRVLNDGITPRQGKKSDQAHPPIHPTKFTDTLQGNEARVYEFVVRHFLACISKNAEGFETTVEINIAGEKFTTSGLQITAKNYLDVYIYEKWNAKEIHLYQERQVFRPTDILMVEEKTSPPNLLTEADLIALMDKHGIGTDATHADHIDTIKSRQYVGIRDNQYLIPGKLGIGLVMGYDNMGFQMSKPNLRAELENDLKLICDGQKTPQEVLQIQIDKYREVFRIALGRANLIDTALSEYLDERPTDAPELDMTEPPEEVVIFKCPKCSSNMTLKDKRTGGGKYIGCMGFPGCTNAIWFPETVTGVEVLPDSCNRCQGFRKLRVMIRPGTVPLLGSQVDTCVGGCDQMFNEIMGIRETTIKRGAGLPDSGYGSNQNTQRSQRSTLGSVGAQSRPIGGVPPGPSTQSTGPRPPPAPPRPPNPGPRGPPGNTRNSKRSSDSRSDPPGSKKPRVAPSAPTSISQPPQNGVHAFMCDCRQPAIPLTVRKEGPNQGRMFYKCSKPKDTGCNFFLWADDANHGEHQPPSPIRNQPTRFGNDPPPRDGHSNHNQGNDNAPQCQCGEPARKLTVRKEGPNQGRQFWGCPKGMGSTCNFFIWADGDGENRPGGGGGGGGGGGSGGGGGGGSRGGRGGRGGGRGGRGGAGGTRAKRKCGVCGVEGHTKRTCPQNK